MDAKVPSRFALLRTRYNLTYKTLMEILGLTRAQARHYLNGTTPLSEEEAIKLAVHLHIDQNWLLYGNGANPFEDVMVSEPAVNYAKSGRSVASNFSVQIGEMLGAIIDELEIKIKVLERRIEKLEEKQNL